MTSSLITTRVDQLVSWARAQSLWTYEVNGGCCASEVLSLRGCRYDLERFGCVPQSNPEQADLLLVSAVMTDRMAEVVRSVYERMSHPRYVIAVGACANSGGAFTSGMNHLSPKSLADIVPVDVFIPGCPPRPEAIMNGLLKLQEKIRETSV